MTRIGSVPSNLFPPGQWYGSWAWVTRAQIRRSAVREGGGGRAAHHAIVRELPLTFARSDIPDLRDLPHPACRHEQLIVAKVYRSDVTGAALHALNKGARCQGPQLHATALVGDGEGGRVTGSRDAIDATGRFHLNDETSICNVP